MPLGSISLQAEVTVSPSAETSDLALAQLGWRSHPLTAGCCLCHSHLPRAREQNRPVGGKKNIKKEIKTKKKKEIRNYKWQQTTTTTKIYRFLLKLFF